MPTERDFSVEGKRAVLATMHGKELVIRPQLEREHRLQVELLDGLTPIGSERSASRSSGQAVSSMQPCQASIPASAAAAILDVTSNGGCDAG